MFHSVLITHTHTHTVTCFLSTLPRMKPPRDSDFIFFTAMSLPPETLVIVTEANWDLFYIFEQPVLPLLKLLSVKL